MPDDVARLCDQVAARLSDRLDGRLVALALYGSAARRPEGPWNDLDFYVIARRLPDDGVARARLLDEAVGPLRPPVRRSLLSATPEEFDGDVTPLMLDLAVDARVIADPEGYLAPRLARLRAILRAADLSREQRPHGFVWRFATLPGGPWVLDWNGYRAVTR